MKYIALLRGINVGGNTKVPMQELVVLCQELGFTNVSTYINSGNVLFESTDDETTDSLAQLFEKRLYQKYTLTIPVLVVTTDLLHAISSKIPNSWTNDTDMKCDVLFLWKEIDSKDILTQLAYNPDIEDVLYTPGAVVWRIDRRYINKGKMVKIVGTAIYKKMTVRNVNTVRKLVEKTK